MLPLGGGAKKPIFYVSREYITLGHITCYCTYVISCTLYKSVIIFDVNQRLLTDFKNSTGGIITLRIHQTFLCNYPFVDLLYLPW